MHAFAPIEEFVPHRGTMLLVQEVAAEAMDRADVGFLEPLNRVGEVRLHGCVRRSQ